jgi:hypothetical protein
VRKPFFDALAGKYQPLSVADGVDG